MQAVSVALCVCVCVAQSLWPRVDPALRRWWFPVVCLALGLIAGGWEMGCNKISDKDSQGWEELWRYAGPVSCPPTILRVPILANANFRTLHPVYTNTTAVIIEGINV